MKVIDKDFLFCLYHKSEPFWQEYTSVANSNLLQATFLSIFFLFWQAKETKFQKRKKKKKKKKHAKLLI